MTKSPHPCYPLLQDVDRTAVLECLALIRSHLSSDTYVNFVVHDRSDPFSSLVCDHGVIGTRFRTYTKRLTTTTTTTTTTTPGHRARRFGNVYGKRLRPG